MDFVGMAFLIRPFPKSLLTSTIALDEQEHSMKAEFMVLPSSDPMLPPLVLHVIHLVDSYMLWIGVSSSGDVDDTQRVTLNGNLGRDWACAMPARMNVGCCETISAEAN